MMYGFWSNLLLSKAYLFGKDKTKVAYGSDVLRLWAATVEYSKDVPIGPTVIAQVAESLRKLRNSARFCLANIGPPEALAKMERVPKAEMGYVRRLSLFLPSVIP